MWSASVRRHTLVPLLLRRMAQKEIVVVSSSLDAASSTFYLTPRQFYPCCRRWSSSKSSNTNSSVPSKDQVIVEGEEWIRPDRPLVGDKGHSHLIIQGKIQEAVIIEEEYYDEEKELARIAQELEELERQERSMAAIAAAAGAAAVTKNTDQTQEPAVDWLKTRRSVFGDQVLAKKQQKKPHQGGELGLPIILHTLLSQTEILSVIQAMGGHKVQVLLNGHGRMGVGYDGMVIVTATNSYQIRSIAVALIRQLRLRQLGDCGVNGATMGTKRKSFSSDQAWLVVDCGNYEVHIQSDAARRFYQLERLWGEACDDPILQVDCLDEEAIDKYLTENPPPPSMHGDYSNNNNSSSSWKETYLRLKNDRSKRNVVMPSSNQARKKKKLNRWR